VTLSKWDRQHLRRSRPGAALDPGRRARPRTPVWSPTCASSWWIRSAPTP